VDSTWARAELQVSDDGLGAQASWYESLAGRLAGARCAFRVQATAAKLAVAATGYDGNEAGSATQLRELDPVAVC
jgi:hypothetical protein